MTMSFRFRRSVRLAPARDIDALLLDIETRADQMRHMTSLEPWRLAAMLAAANVIAGSAAAAAILWTAHLVIR